MIANSYFEYWPFPINEAEKTSQEELEKFEFLKDIYFDGFKAYREIGKWDEYATESETRKGFISRRGVKNRWELNLSEAGSRLTAFVNNFSVAGEAVKEWLNGNQISDILENIKDYLIIPSKLGSSYIVYGIQQYWPFPFCEEEKQRSELIEKIDFLQSAYLDGFKAYRDTQKQVRYGAKSQSREGYIQKAEKGNLWEFKLLDIDQEHFRALVTDFVIAGQAVKMWLSGRSINDVFEIINNYLAIPSGLQASYTKNESEASTVTPKTID
jgi:hypothetical protein